MAIKRNSLRVNIAYDFDVIGIISSAKEYKIAWILNQCANCNFTKTDDIEIELLAYKNITISSFCCKSEYMIMYLLKNRLVFNNALSDKYLLPELKQFDYFVKVDGESDLYPTEAILATLKSSETIEYATGIDPNTLKHRENLIF